MVLELKPKKETKFCSSHAHNSRWVQEHLVLNHVALFLGDLPQIYVVQVLIGIPPIRCLLIEIDVWVGLQVFDVIDQVRTIIYRTWDSRSIGEKITVRAFFPLKTQESKLFLPWALKPTIPIFPLTSQQTPIQPKRRSSIRKIFQINWSLHRFCTRAPLSLLSSSSSSLSSSTNSAIDETFANISKVWRFRISIAREIEFNNTWCVAVDISKVSEVKTLKSQLDEKGVRWFACTWLDIVRQYQLKGLQGEPDKKNGFQKHKWRLSRWLAELHLLFLDHLSGNLQCHVLEKKCSRPLQMPRAGNTVLNLPVFYAAPCIVCSLW